MAADKDNRKADASRSKDPVRDSANSGSSRRDLVPVEREPSQTSR